MENTELQVWIKEMAGYDAGDIPLQILPAFQILRDKMAQSERKIQALLRQKQLFTLLVNGTADMFVMFSAKDYKVEYVSPNIEYLLGLPLDEVRGNIQRLYDTAPDFEPPTREQLMAIPLGGSIQFLNEHIHQRKQEHRWYQKTFYHFFLNNDHKLMLVMSDRTTEMEMQRQLEISIEMTKSANEAKSSFLANMSHDIRTPMNAIVGFSSLLKREAENPAKVREYARKISSSSDHLLNLINDILDMSKIESGKTILHIEEFNLSELLEGIGIVVNPQAKAKNQEFRIRTKGITCDHLQGDKTRINQILMNLLSNAVKYTPEGGNIQLILSQEGQIDGAEAHEHIQQCGGHAVLAGGFLHGDVVDITLVQHGGQTGVAQHAALAVLGDDEAGGIVIQGVLQLSLAPGGGEALALQLGDLVDMAPIHGYDLVIHKALLLKIIVI